MTWLDDNAWTLFKQKHKDTIPHSHEIIIGDNTYKPWSLSSTLISYKVNVNINSKLFIFLHSEGTGHITPEVTYQFTALCRYTSLTYWFNAPSPYSDLKVAQSVILVLGKTPMGMGMGGNGKKFVNCMGMGFRFWDFMGMGKKWREWEEGMGMRRAIPAHLYSKPHLHVGAGKGHKIDNRMQSVLGSSNTECPIIKITRCIS